MRHVICIWCVAAIVGFSATLQASPTTRPNAAEPPMVLLLPFVPPADGTSQWIGKSVQQDLAAALAPNLRGRAIAPTTAPAAADESSALATAPELNAAVVVFGQAQLMGKQIRLTGQVVDVATGKSLGNMKATGPIDDLFRLEDTLAQQTLDAMPQSVLNLGGIAQARQANPPRIIYLPGDTQTTPLSNGPIDGGAYPASSFSYLLPPAPGSPPPYSPYAGSYPYRFYYPYAHLLNGDEDFNPFLPPYTGFGYWRGGAADHPGRRH